MKWIETERPDVYFFRTLELESANFKNRQEQTRSSAWKSAHPEQIAQSKEKIKLGAINKPRRKEVVAQSSPLFFLGVVGR